MRRAFAATAAALLGTVLVLAASTPAQAINVRYRAAASCTVDGGEFRADIHTYGKPTADNPGALTEVQLWGYRFSKTVNAKMVAARIVRWYRDADGKGGSWKDAGPLGYLQPGISNGAWHNGPIDTRQFIGYLSSDSPLAIQVIAYVYQGGVDITSCNVYLRPSDLKWIG